MPERRSDNGKQSYSAIASNDIMDVLALRGRWDERLPAGIMLHTRVSHDPRATFAMACIERWGMIAGIPDGEDSAGRSRLRLATPVEVVQRACDCTEQAFSDFQKRGWLVEIPAFAELVDKVKDQENTND